MIAHITWDLIKLGTLKTHMRALKAKEGPMADVLCSLPCAPLRFRSRVCPSFFAFGWLPPTHAVVSFLSVFFVSDRYSLLFPSKEIG